MRCRSCDHDNRAERRFCAECGAPLGVSCVACGAANEPSERFCGGCGAQLEAPASGRTTTPSAGERRQLTVLFCDLVGSTALSQQLDAEDWREVVGQYQKAARVAVERWGGDEHVRVLGNDQGVSALNHVAWNLWHLGRPDAALARARESVTLARQLGDPFSLACALFFETSVHWWRRDIAAQRERATEVVALCETQGFPYWLGLGRAIHAGARVVAADAGALAEILDGMALVAEIGNQLGGPALIALLAEAQRAAGQLAAAQGTVSTALAVAAQTGQFFFNADLHRLDGDLLLATAGTADEAAARYHRALAIAREQGTRSLELRAATSLARLWRDQGKTVGSSEASAKEDAARALLAPVYDWFTEGLDTQDLIDAKALLEEL